MNPKILIIDDDHDLLLLLKALLEEDPYDIDLANNFETAMTSLTEEEYDIVILDKNIPGRLEPVEGGMEILRFIKINIPSTEVIMITGFATIASAVEAMRLGAFDYLHKPFKRDEIRQKVQRLIEYKSFLDPESTIQNYKIIFNKILESLPHPENKQIRTERDLAQLMADVDLLFNVQKDLERIVIAQRNALEQVAGEVEKLKELCPSRPEIRAITDAMERLVSNRV